jgi:hypothetical protein
MKDKPAEDDQVDLAELMEFVHLEPAAVCIGRENAIL